MYSKVKTFIPNGLAAISTVVEVSILNGLPSFNISGLSTSQSLQMESRLRAALTLTGLRWPKGRIIAAIAPAWLAKKSTIFDLPIAIALLLASGQIPPFAESLSIIGELGLDGSIKAVPGIYSCLALAAKEKEEILILPEACKEEASYLDGLAYVAVKNLNHVLDFYRGRKVKLRKGKYKALEEHSEIDEKTEQAFISFKGQRSALRALKISLSGWHPLALLGSPGCGKTMLCSLAQYLLPPLNADEWYELKNIYSVAEHDEKRVLAYRQRPYIAPHYTVTPAALCGGGRAIKPGLFSLAHRGILFLDEFSEYQPLKLNLLRETMSEQAILLARAEQSLKLPAKFLLLAAANPCPCGYIYEKDEQCKCTDHAVRKYLGKVSGAIWDRFHLVDLLERESPLEILEAEQPPQSIYEFREEICQVWELAARRVGQESLVPENLNALNEKFTFDEAYGFTSELLSMARKYAHEKQLNFRSYKQLLRVARTIADLEQSVQVDHSHIVEAGYYQSKPLEKLGV